MSILNFLKKIKLPRFEDDFIQDQVDKIIEERPLSHVGRFVCDTHKSPEVKAKKENIQEWMDGEWERHGDPSDGASMSTLDVWDE